MASEQLSRRENTTNERQMHVEKDTVPKMTSHFEHLAEKVKEDSATSPHGSVHGYGCERSSSSSSSSSSLTAKSIGDIGGPGKARETHELGTRLEALSGRERQKNSTARETERRGSGVNAQKGAEEASRNRRNESDARTATAIAEGQDFEARRGTEQRRHRGTDSISGGGVVAEEASRNKRNETKMDNTEKAGEERGRVRETKEEKGVRERYVEIENALEGKDMTAESQDATAEKGRKGYFPAKDAISTAARTAADYTAPVAEKAKDYTVKTTEIAKSASGTAASYIGEKAAQARDVTVVAGKSAAGKAGEVAADLKDKAAAAGWAAAHYSAEKTVEGTKVAARAAEGAAGYAGHKASEIASKSLGAVKDLAAQAGETVVEYTARKREEREHELEAKKATHPQVYISLALVGFVILVMN